jgi:hypothetical protein
LIVHTQPTTRRSSGTLFSLPTNAVGGIRKTWSLASIG